MLLVLVTFNWIIALLVIWNLPLDPAYIWLPVTAVIVLLGTTAVSVPIVRRLDIPPDSRLTVLMAASLSNLGYTGGAFVCYALFGTVGLGLAHIYVTLWLPAAYLVFLPILKLHEARRTPASVFSWTNIFDARYLPVPAVLLALALNLRGLPVPAFVARIHLVDIFVYTASAMAFFAIGMQVKFSHLRRNKALYLIVSGIKFVVSPLLALAVIVILKITGQEITGLVPKIILVLAACPSAVMMVTMSNAFGLDGRLASALWVVTTAIFVAVVIPILIVLLA
jgi:predicted permease